jgi:hypothetical protein
MKKAYGGGVSIQRDKQPLTGFVKWLCGVNPADFGREACSFAALLPKGIQASSLEAVAQAVSLALERHGLSADAVIRFVFSRLSSYDREKATAVVSSLICRVPRDEIPALVRAAVIVRPRLAMTVVRLAVAQAPDQAMRIWDAAESVVVGLQPAQDAKSGIFPRV